MSGMKQNFLNAFDPLHIGLARKVKKKKDSTPAAVAQVQPTMDDSSVQAALDEQQRQRLLAQSRAGTALSDSTNTADQLG